ncbi:DUF58 domain-containing protein [Schaalia suimastitidis]|uniref:DUF58 domain-containing protein n=1 Tax=Schaalia suimastitidis TaxID=121163 RepID=UPI0003FD129A|nr:DUF58 domain-containing protein [Schaalia suimastitidis]
MALSWRAAALAAVGVIPLVFIPTHALAWGWLFLVLVVCALDLYLALSPRLLRVEREVTETLRADEHTESIVTITNPTKRGIRLHIRDAWPPSTHPTPAHHHALLPGGDTVRVVTTLTPQRRGTRAADRVTLRVWGPLGVAARQISLVAPLKISVLPEFRARRLLPSRLARLHELEGSTATVLRGPGTEFDSLREYVRGDDPRDIDWRASARTPELVVRTWRPERDRHVVIVLDAGRSGALLLGAPRDVAEDANALDLGAAPRIDAGIEAALLLGALADRAGDQVHFLAIDREVRARVSGIRGPGLLQQCASSLVDVSASLQPIDWKLVVAEVGRTVRHAACVVLLTELPPAGTDPELSEAVQILLRSHTVIVASAQDPTVTALAQGRDGSGDVFSAASAASVLRETAHGAQDLRRQGAVVADVDAGRLAARLSDLYIELKKAGRL